MYIISCLLGAIPLNGGGIYKLKHQSCCFVDTVLAHEPK